METIPSEYLRRLVTAELDEPEQYAESETESHHPEEKAFELEESVEPPELEETEESEPESIQLEDNRYKLVERFEHSDIFVDPHKVEKQLLTDFINKRFLKSNDNELRLLQLIYNTLQPVLNKHCVRLIFKGGNVMRMVSNNLRKYFEPLANAQILDVFEPYLSQSDIDFTVLVDPNTPQYDAAIETIIHELEQGLTSIKQVLTDNLANYFDLFNLSNHNIRMLFGELARKLDVNDVTFAATRDKYVRYADPSEPSTSDVLVFDDMLSTKQLIYNTSNFALDFTGPHGETTSFYLLRSKVNFKIGGIRQTSGELIDIAIPHKNDFIMEEFHTSADFLKYIDVNVTQQFNTQYQFTYYTINLQYIVTDLMRILFFQNYYPWDDSKYVKRVARLMYFIFLLELESSRISASGYERINDQFYTFTQQLNDLGTSAEGSVENPNWSLQFTYDATRALYAKLKPTLIDTQKMDEFVKYLYNFAESVIKITYSLVQFHFGRNRAKSDQTYALEII